MSFLSVLGKIGSFIPGVGPLIGLGTDIAGGIINQNQISKATNAQINAANQGVGQIAYGRDQAIDAFRGGQQQSYEAQLGTLGRVNALNQPYADTGGQAYQSLAGMVNRGDLNVNFDPNSVQMDPGFQFRMDEAMKALSRSAAGRSALKSGGTLKELEKYSQGLASQEYQNAYGRALSTYGAQRQSAQDIYNRYMGLSDVGERAVGRMGGAEENFGNQTQALNTWANTGIANAYQGGAREISDLMTGRGAVQSAGSLAQANNVTGMLGNAGRDINQMWSLGRRRQPTGGWQSYMPEADMG